MITKTLENIWSKRQIVVIINLVVSIIMFSLAVYKVKTFERKAVGDVTDDTPTCLPAILPYGVEAENPSPTTVRVSVQNFKLLTHDISSGELEAHREHGWITFRSENEACELVVCVSCCTRGYNDPDRTPEQFFFERELTADERAKVACLISVDGVVFGHMFGWISMVCGDVPGAIVQTILAIASNTSAYVLRSWSNDVTDVNSNQFKTFVRYEDNSSDFDTDFKAKDVTGKMCITSVSVQYETDILPLAPENRNIELCTEM